MKYFPDPITPLYFASGSSLSTRSVDAAPASLSLPQSRGLISFLGEGGATLNRDELQNQFILFQLSNDLGQPSLLESSQIEPVFEGSADEPDVLMKVTLESFHVAKSEEIDEKTSATIRITINSDPMTALDRNLDVLFWTVAAGIDLYNAVKNNGNSAQGNVIALSNYAEDFQRPFNQRPIEILGGLANFHFEVIKHKAEPWWKRVFNFLETRTGEEVVRLVGEVIGLPGVTGTALRLIEELFERLSDANSEVIFQGRPMRLALTQFARDQYTAGNPRVRMGALNPGFAVLARGRDFPLFAERSFVYLPAYGKLLPSEVADNPSALMSGQYEDPLADVSYGVLRVGMSEASVDPVFLYAPRRA
jgi:hypothetical protein